jgi:uncharacterized damage-inducible protein DinB
MSIETSSRPQAPYVADERTMLEGFLDFHRATLLWKCEGLSDDELKRRAVPPSPVSLLGLVRHLTEVERGWFLDFTGTYDGAVYVSKDAPEADWDGVDDADPATDMARYKAEVDRIRAELAGRHLDETQVDQTRGTVSLRWIYNHMVEEYARHNGHADLIREVIDGATGE